MSCTEHSSSNGCATKLRRYQLTITINIREITTTQYSLLIKKGKILDKVEVFSGIRRNCLQELLSCMLVKILSLVQVQPHAM
jgi:hypothetical protein